MIVMLVEVIHFHAIILLMIYKGLLSEKLYSSWNRLAILLIICSFCKQFSGLILRYFLICVKQTQDLSKCEVVMICFCCVKGAVNFALMMSQMEGGCPIDYNTITDLFLQV